jgi:hypothetical protein
VTRIARPTAAKRPQTTAIGSQGRATSIRRPPLGNPDQ